MKEVGVPRWVAKWVYMRLSPSGISICALTCSQMHEDAVLDFVAESGIIPHLSDLRDVGHPRAYE